MIHLPLAAVGGSSGGFLTQNRLPIFVVALCVSILTGIVAATMPWMKYFLMLCFMATLVFPTTDISFFVDHNFIGVPSARGLYVTFADLFILALAIALILGGGGRLKLSFPGFTPYVALIVVSALSIVFMLSYRTIIFTYPPYVYGFFELFNLIKGLLVFWVMVNFMQGEKQIRLIVFILMAVIVIEAVAVVYHQYVLHWYMRSGGTLGHSNGLAMFMGMILPTVLVLMLASRKGGWVPVILGVLIVMGIALMIKTVSRAGLIGMLISCSLALALLALKVRRIHAARVALLIVLVGLGGAALTYKFWDKIVARFGLTSGEAKMSNITRITLLKAGVDIWLQNPILGNGINSFPIEITLNKRGLDEPTEEHNLYLLILCEMGILGLLAFLAVVFRIFQYGVRLIRQNINPSFRILAIGLTCGMFHVLFESFFEFSFRVFLIAYLFWTYAAILIALWYMFKKQALQIQTARMALARQMAAGGKTPVRRTRRYQYRRT
jgi:O-antigen ligase